MFYFKMKPKNNVHLYLHLLKGIYNDSACYRMTAFLRDLFTLYGQRPVRVPIFPPLFTLCVYSSLYRCGFKVYIYILNTIFCIRPVALLNRFMTNIMGQHRPLHFSSCLVLFFSNEHYRQIQEA